MNGVKKPHSSLPILIVLGWLRRNWSWVVLIVFALAIRCFANDPESIEIYYSQGVYPSVSGLMRGVLDWLPFSVGDLLYGFFVFWGILGAGQIAKRLIKRRGSWINWFASLRKFCFFSLIVYIVFNVFWGLNYNRLGIGSQLALSSTVVSLQEIDTLTVKLLAQANYYSNLVDTKTRNEFHRKQKLFNAAQREVEQASKKYPFLKARIGAVKPSLYSYLGNYLGFQGYYNPFTGEGQVNTTIPVFLRPFVATHEIAHQLGYAKESEANFVGFLICREAKEPLFRYAAYLDMYLYAHAILYQVDSIRANDVKLQRNAIVQSDIQNLRSFYLQYQTPIEELVMQGYDYFLQANEQPQGKQSYSQVLRWLMAWVRKNGWENL